jgi:hypothetical protein
MSRFMVCLYVIAALLVPGGGGGAAAGGRAALAGRCLFIEAPRRRPHTIPHVNWLLATHFSRRDRSHDANAIVTAAASDRQTLTPI